LFLLFHFFPSISPIEKWKIQPNKREKNGKILTMLLTVIFNHSTAVFAASFSNDLYTYLDLRTDIESIPPWYIIFSQVALCAFLYDLFFYLTHRAMHLPFLYPYHKVHHSSTISMGLTQSYFHPVDFWLSFPAFLLPPLLVSRHVVTWCIWNLAFTAESLTMHCGYRFPFLPWDTSVHDYHHSHPHKPANYGAFWGIWDKLFETDKAYWEYVEEKKNQEKEKAEKMETTTEKTEKIE
jgi:sterol desaturase/sphingolipid hydroxylase (fatty acid hydroxylase superfamily)